MIVISSLSCMFFGPSPSLQSWVRMMALLSVMLQLCEMRPEKARKLVFSVNKLPQPIPTTSSQFWHIFPILTPTRRETDPDLEPASRALRSLIESHNPSGSPIK
jgi:hypothetical protein